MSILKSIVRFEMLGPHALLLVAKYPGPLARRDPGLVDRSRGKHETLL